MPLYKYETLVELPDNEAARVVIQNIHLAVCGGDTHVGEDGEIQHECARWWESQVHGFVPIAATEPLEGAVDFQEDSEGDALHEDSVADGSEVYPNDDIGPGMPAGGNSGVDAGSPENWSN